MFANTHILICMHACSLGNVDSDSSCIAISSQLIFLVLMDRYFNFAGVYENLPALGMVN